MAEIIIGTYNNNYIIASGGKWAIKIETSTLFYHNIDGPKNSKLRGACSNIEHLFL